MSSSDSWGYESAEEEALPATGTAEATSFTVYSASGIEELQRVQVATLSEDFGVSLENVMTLLVVNNWDSEQAALALIEDSVCFLCKSMDSFTVSSSAIDMCTICFIEFPTWEMRKLSCLHMFCRTCYTQYLFNALAEGEASALLAKCPYSSCEVIVPCGLFRQLLNDSSYQKYMNFYRNSFVERNIRFKWCPYPDCRHSVLYPEDLTRDIICECGFVWCFKCSNEAHRPLSCKQLIRWREEYLGQDLDSKWILVNTKNCPKCMMPIEKNEGCMHMTCNCKHEFCWLCLGPWSEHGENTGGFYGCNIFQENMKKGLYSGEQKDREMTAAKLQLLNDCVERYLEHKKSLGFAIEKRRKKLNDIQDIQNAVGYDRTRDPLFLDAACTLIIEVRSAVVHMHPYQYFLTSFEKVKFSEFLRSRIENYLEDLDELTDVKYNQLVNERGPTEYFLLIKLEVEELTRVLREHFEKCMSSIESGLSDVGGSEGDNIDEVLRNCVLSEERSHWACSMCTFMNDTDTQICEICSSHRALFRE